MTTTPVIPDVVADQLADYLDAAIANGALDTDCPLDLTAADWRVTVTLRPDYDSSLDDYDYYGQVEPCDPYRRNEYGHMARPDWCDGSARKLWVRGDSYWWLPPSDTLNNPDLMADMAAHVCHLIEFGWFGMVVRIDHRCGCCDEWRYVTEDALFGLDTLDLPELADIAKDLLWTCVDQQKREVTA